MSQNKSFRLCYLMSAAMLIIFAGTFLMMPISNRLPVENTKTVLVLIGTIFWISCISGYSLLFGAYRLDRKNGRRKKQRKRVYVFTNIPTKIADTALVMGLILFIILMGQSLSEYYVVYVDLFIIVLSFNMHLLCNRGLYKRIIEKSKN